jgi:hypothetical protein
VEEQGTSASAMGEPDWHPPDAQGVEAGGEDAGGGLRSSGVEGVVEASLVVPSTQAQSAAWMKGERAPGEDGRGALVSWRIAGAA